MERFCKIAVVGPESSGKSRLTQELALHFNEPWVEEVAREYLEQRDGQYDEKDLLHIAKKQLENEKIQQKGARQFLFCDTNLLVILIWSQWKYNRISPDLLNLWKADDYDLHLLCAPDLPYEEDPLRENPLLEERETLFQYYKEWLEKSNIPFRIVSGIGSSRLENSIAEIQQIFSS